MLFGAHVSIAGGVDQAPARAKEIGCEVFQIFSRSPRGGKPPELTSELVKSFKAEMNKNKQVAAYIHTPYYINLASTNNRIRFGSIEIIREELERASILSLPYIMTHLGSANDLSRSEAVAKVAEGVKKVLTGYKGSAMLLLENAAGSGQVIGADFAELKIIIKGLNKSEQAKVGICLDTCHAFASGYDLRDKKSVSETLKEFDKIIGLSKLKLIHLNDSKTEFGQRVDRHEHIGQGKIGKAGFKAWIGHPKLNKVNMILETPNDESGSQAEDLKYIKSLRK
ncbi:MAG: endonuclease [Candidatus Komeilibacteria bacterium CG10_big_fil_rev_8_21_14_0_10_41_13]|uniref:Probable endonuclease 4 n=1 Tax=Candidatus Komeilibacteria bacterium CG10_big_fil_rev_8_21_14_0_10_41_13 TaxID=1974476 RepID=A0A2M6WC08_9BACT|nr:MAG: endonuclease [Candidatus Komeilibacteria bacterium CG10_big_fil_rev_8_21_14_0_10_41_13]